MFKHSSRRLFIYSLVVLLLEAAGGSVWAKVTVTATLSKNVLRVGETSTLQIQVLSEGEQIAQTPTLPTLDGLNFVYANQQSSQQFQFINGRASSSYEILYQYEVYALKEGKYTLSDISVASSAGTITANPLEMTVFPGSAPLPTRAPQFSAPQGAENLNVYLLADSNKKEVYLGEEVILSYDAVYHQQYKRWLDQVIYYNKEYVSITEEKGTLKNFLSETIDTKFQSDTKPVRIAGNRDLYFQKSLRRYVLYPLSPGDYSLVPLTAEFALPIQRLAPVAYQPEPIQIKVKSLPSEGKPDIFEGAVGSFNIKAEAEPLELSVGETVTLRVILDGIGNIKNAPKPILPDFSKFDQFDPTQKENITVSETGMRGQITFSYVLIPHDVHSNAIGPVRYAYFDPEQKKYIVKETDPISLTVRPSSGSGVRTVSNAAFNRRLITRVGDDFRFIVTGSAGLSTIVLPVHRTVLFWIVALIPGLVSILAFLRKWRGDYLAYRPTVARSLKAPRLARQLLDDARQAIDRNDREAVYLKMSKAITDYIDHRWNLTCAGLTGQELKENLLQNGLEESQADSILAMLNEFDGVRFSGASQNQEQIQRDYQQTEELLSGLIKMKNAK